MKNNSSRFSPAVYPEQSRRVKTIEDLKSHSIREFKSASSIVLKNFGYIGRINLRLLSILLLVLCAGVASNSFGMKRTREVFEGGSSSSRDDQDPDSDENQEEAIRDDEGQSSIKRRKKDYTDKDLFDACKINDIEKVRLLIKKDINLDRLYKTDLNELFSESITSLMVACENGFFDIVKLLVENGAKINKISSHFNRSLYFACKSGHLKIVKYLVSKGVEIDEHKKAGEAPIFIAVENNYYEIVKFLVEKGAFLDIYSRDSDGSTLLFTACKKGYFDIVKLLVENGATINTSYDKSILLAACESGNCDIIEYLIENRAVVRMDLIKRYGQLLFCAACWLNKIRLVEKIVESGFKVDLNAGVCPYDNPLYSACNRNNLEMVKYLVKNGAKKSINIVSEDGHTPLSLACANNNFEMVKYLVENGANVKDTNFKQKFSLLIACKKNKDRKIVDCLISKGALLEYTFMKAVLEGELEVIKFLYEEKKVNKIIFFKENNGSFTSLDLALLRRRYEVAKYLRSLGIPMLEDRYYSIWKYLKDIEDRLKKIEDEIIKGNLLEYKGKKELNILHKLIFLMVDYFESYFKYINNEVKVEFANNNNNFRFFNRIQQKCYKEMNLINEFKHFFDNMKRVLSLLFKKTGSKLNYEVIEHGESKKRYTYPLIKIFSIFKRKDLVNINNIDLKKTLVKNIKDIIDLLMENGSDINHKDFVGNTPVFYTCLSREVQLDAVTGGVYYDCFTKYLIEKHKAKVNVKNKMMLSPLCWAIYAGNKHSIIALLEAGANMKNLNEKGDDFYTVLKTSKVAKRAGLDKYFLKIKVLKDKFEEIKNKALLKKKFLLKKKIKSDKCFVCLEEFNDENRKKIFYVPCGHANCLTCVKKLFIDNEKLKCEICRESKSFMAKDIEFESL